MKLEWDAIWDEFDKWYQTSAIKHHCADCKHEHILTTEYPDWEDQQDAIARIVNKYLRRR